MDAPLTSAETRALSYLADAQEPQTPADVGFGMAVGADYPKLHSSQGAGRLGGTMLWRLERRGLVMRKRHFERWTRWQITSAGRAALRPSTGKEKSE